MNNLLNNLRRCRNKQDIEAVINYYIEAYVNESKRFNRKNYLGRDVGINPKREVIAADDLGINMFDVNTRWVGYIPNNIKVVYYRISDHGYLYNDGGYYYMGDEDYLYEFAEWISDQDVTDDMNLILLVDQFVHKYFDNNIDPVTREIRHQLLYDKNGDGIPPTVEHQLSDFKGIGAGLCSEYAVMGQNIMTIFGLETELIFGDKHAFNIYFEKNGEVNVVDFKQRVNVYDMNQRLSAILPFVEPIDGYDDNLYSEFLSGAKSLSFPNYSVVVIGRTHKIMMDDLVRVYRTGGTNLRQLIEDAEKKDKPKLILKKG